MIKFDTAELIPDDLTYFKQFAPKIDIFKFSWKSLDINYQTIGKIVLNQSVSEITSFALDEFYLNNFWEAKDRRKCIGNNTKKHDELCVTE